MDASQRRDLRERAQSLADFVVTARRDIHAHPELGNQEKRTPALIVDALREAGEFEIRTGVGGTGVVAVLRGAKPGRTLASAQPLPRVLPALDFAPFDEDTDDSVLPAFDSADLLGFPMLLTPFRCRHLELDPGYDATRSLASSGRPRPGGAQHGLV